MRAGHSEPISNTVITTNAVAIGAAVVLLGLLALPAAGQPRGDFNGDGYADLAIGVVSEDLGNDIHGAGAVNVIYGSAGDGLTAAGDQIWSQDSAGVVDDAETDDGFGFSLAVGDFNGDGYSDLAVGVIGESVGATPNAGAVSVIYGSIDGLTAAGDQIWHQNSPGIAGGSSNGDNFGYSLASGDFDGDGYHDLAIGIPGESIGGGFRAGAVQIIYGRADGLNASGSQRWHQNSAAILDVAEAGDEFGFALASGDFNGDAVYDLAIGVRGEGLFTGGGLPIPGAGAANVLYGDLWVGLTAEGNQFWHQDVPGVKANAGVGDEFGFSLAAGDFNDDSYWDLAIGVPSEDLVRVLDVGGVNVLYGFHEGLIVENNQFWHQDITGVLEKAEPGDLFGASLAAGDFNGDDYYDLAIGVPHEGKARKIGTGLVNVLYGSTEGGLNAAGDQVWHQNTPRIEEKGERWDQYGSALASDDYDGNGKDDLAIGVFNESVGRTNGAGAVNVIYGGRARGLRDSDDQLWHQHTTGIKGARERFDWFGWSLGGH